MRLVAALLTITLSSAVVLPAQTADATTKKTAAAKSTSTKTAPVTGKSGAPPKSAAQSSKSPAKASTSKTSITKSSTTKTSTTSATARRGPSKTAKSKTAKNVAPPRRSAQQQPTVDRYKEIQQALADKGYFTGLVDGNWGEESADAMRRFQHDQNITEDGKIGSLSLIALGLGSRRVARSDIPQP